MKNHVMVSETNHLTAFYIAMQRHTALCLPEHALRCAEGVSMTWLFHCFFDVLMYDAAHHADECIAPTIKNQCHGERSEPPRRVRHAMQRIAPTYAVPCNVPHYEKRCHGE
jgi:hypothetical protein